MALWQSFSGNIFAPTFIPRAVLIVVPLILIAATAVDQSKKTLGFSGLPPLCKRTFLMDI